MPMGHMAPMPIPAMASSSMPSSTGARAVVSQQSTPILKCGDDKVDRTPIQGAHQMQVPRACWTPTEEEVLVKTYADFTIGKRLKKVNRRTWEAIAQELFRESKQHMPQVSLKSWMQCKDKWNNMIKKHKLQRTEYSRGSSEGIVRERSSLYEAVERVLSYENEAELTSFAEQDMGEEESVTMVMKMSDANKGKTPVGSEREMPDLGHGVTEGEWEKNVLAEERYLENRRLGDQEHLKNMDNRLSALYGNSAEDDDFDDDGDERMQVSGKHVNGAIQSKRSLAEDNDEHGNRKRSRVIADEETSVNEKLCRILMQQTELLERAHAQHCELLQQVRLSEENTRMMMTQAIKDLGTILNKLIKSENF